MLKAIYIAGVPASGKSLIMRRIRGCVFKDASQFQHGCLRGLRDGNFWTYGVFDGSLFEGTDKLSMCVINDALAHVETLQKDVQKHVLILEGDRLFNERFLKAARATVIVVDAAEPTLRMRHALRKDNQTETRLKACRTKVENFCKKHRVSRLFNNKPADLERIVGKILSIASNYLAEPAHP